jgi:hypothetical protein
VTGRQHHPPRRRAPGGGWSDPSPVADGFIVTPCLRPTRLAEVQFEGRTFASAVSVAAGGLLVYALDDRARRVRQAAARPLGEPFLATMRWERG